MKGKVIKLKEADPKKATILISGDDMRLHTGFANQIRKIVGAIRETDLYNIVRVSWFPLRDLSTCTSTGIYDGLLIPDNEDLAVFLCDNKNPNDATGGVTTYKAIGKYNPDIVLTVGDLQMVSYMSEIKKARAKYGAFYWMHYLPIDGAPLPLDWSSTFDYMDNLILFGGYGYSVVTNHFPHIADRITVIPHCVDMDTFKPQPDRDLVRSVMGWKKDNFVVGYIGRTHARKCVDRLLTTFKKFISGSSKCVDCGNIIFSDEETSGQCICGSKDNFIYTKPKTNALLYMHSPSSDAGPFSVHNLINSYGLNNFVHFPSDMVVGHGIEEDDLAQIEGAADVHVNTSYGEGWCLHPETLITAGGGPTPINLLRGDGDDFVLGRDGNLWEIERVLTREYRGDMVQIKTATDDGDLLVTPEHRCFALNKYSKTIDVCVGTNEEIAEITAEGIHKAVSSGKQVYVPFPKLPAYEHSESSLTIDDFSINIDDNLGTLLGAYMALGRCSARVAYFDLRFDLNNRVAYRKSLITALKFFVPARDIGLSPDKGSIMVSNAQFIRFIKKMFDEEGNISFPYFWVLRSVYTSVIKSYTLAIGDCRKHVLRLACSSYDIAWQIKMMLLEHNVVGFHRVVSGRNFIDIKDYGQNFMNLCNITGENYEKSMNKIKTTSNRPFILCDRYVFYRVTSADKIPYSGTVYNLSIPNNETYCTDKILVHNCIPIHEALACGRPVVVPNHSAMATDLVINEKNGLLANIQTHIVIDGGFARPLVDTEHMAYCLDRFYYKGEDGKKDLDDRWGTRFGNNEVLGHKMKEYEDNAVDSVKHYNQKDTLNTWVKHINSKNSFIGMDKTIEYIKENVTDKPRVLYVTANLDPPGNEKAVSCLSMMDHLSRKDLQCYALSTYMNSNYVFPNMRVRTINNFLSINSRDNFYDLWKIVQAIDPHLVVTDGDMTVGLSNSLKGLGVPHLALVNSSVGNENKYEESLYYANYVFNMINRPEREYGGSISNVGPYIYCGNNEEIVSFSGRRSGIGISYDGLNPKELSLYMDIMCNNYMRPHHIHFICQPGVVLPQEIVRTLSALGNINLVSNCFDIEQNIKSLMLWVTFLGDNQFIDLSSILALKHGVPIVANMHKFYSKVFDNAISAYAQESASGYIQAIGKVLSSTADLQKSRSNSISALNKIVDNNEKIISKIEAIAIKHSNEKNIKPPIVSISEHSNDVALVIPFCKTKFVDKIIDNIVSTYDKDFGNIAIYCVSQCPEWVPPKYDDVPVDYVTYDTKLGWCVACNIGIKAVREKYPNMNVCTINDDVVLPNGWNRTLISKFDISDDIWAVGPDSNNPFHGQYNMVSGVSEKCADEISKIAYRFKGEKYVMTQFLSGFMTIFKPECIDNIGPLDEDFNFRYYDDNDYCWRIAKAGKKMLLSYDCYVFHYGSQSHPQSTILGAEGRDLIIKKHGSIQNV